jgi:hypothetical protein
MAKPLSKPLIRFMKSFADAKITGEMCSPYTGVENDGFIFSKELRCKGSYLNMNLIIDPSVIKKAKIHVVKEDKHKDAKLVVTYRDGSHAKAHLPIEVAKDFMNWVNNIEMPLPF